MFVQWRELGECDVVRHVALILAILTEKRESFRIRISTCSCMGPFVCDSWKALLQTSSLMLPGWGSLWPCHCSESQAPPPLCPAHCQLMLLLSSFPSLIVCLPTLPGLFKQNADISFLFSIHKATVFTLYTLVNWTMKTMYSPVGLPQPQAFGLSSNPLHSQQRSTERQSCMWSIYCSHWCVSVFVAG